MLLIFVDAMKTHLRSTTRIARNFPLLQINQKVPKRDARNTSSDELSQDIRQMLWKETLTVTGDFPGKTSIAGRGSGSIPNSNSHVEISPTGHRMAINSRTESRSSVELCVNKRRPGTGPNEHQIESVIWLSRPLS